ncbi:hypothetical protein SESBI_18025 [Sesbania bispinosa]|nr:hypothetical protein SESBI_18025 [Sesbania bispinosa]
MLSCLCLFKSTPSWMALLALLLFFSSYLLLGFGFFSILYTSIVVVLSSVLYTTTVSKHKVAVHVDKLVEDKALSSEEESSDQRENIAPTPLHKIEKVTEAKEAQEVVYIDGAPNYSTTSPDLLSESECQDQLSTSEDSEVGWTFRYDVDHSPDCSDGSISDEESLIEIALPSGHYVDQKKYNCSLQQKKRELSAESLFSQQSLMEFLSEFNEVSEEENLIEIDISMGSIKYSRFEIKA